MKTKSILSVALGAICISVLTSCATENKVPRYTVEDLPENKAPILVREKTSKYDIYDDETFPLYENFQTVDLPSGVKLSETSNLYLQIYPTKDATYLVYHYDCRNHDNEDWLFFYFGEEDCIVDAETGQRYQVRKLQYYPLGTFFYHHKNARTFHQIIAEYPPLPKSVKKIKFWDSLAPTRKWYAGGSGMSKEYLLREFFPPVR